MLVNILRTLLIIWIGWTLIKWFNRWRTREKRKAFEAGKRAARNKNGHQHLNTEDMGDYIDYEEMK